MKYLTYAYLTKRECSVQESVYHILQGHWLRKTFPGIVLANSNTPKKDAECVLMKGKFLSCQRILKGYLKEIW